MKFIQTIINNQEYAPKCFIHTIQIFIPKNELERWEKEKGCEITQLKNQKLYINQVKKTRYDTAYVVINPNKSYAQTRDEIYKNIYTLEQYIQTILYVINDIDVVEWYYNRIDIAFDIPIITDDTYRKLYNINYMLIDCICYCKNMNHNFIVNLNGENNCKNSMSIKNNSKFNLEIYDKKLESKGKFKSTRIEFRYLSLNKKENKESNEFILKQCLRETKRVLNEIKKKEFYNATIEYYKKLIMEDAGNFSFTKQTTLQQRIFIETHSNLFISSEVFEYFYNDVLALNLNEEQIRQKKKHYLSIREEYENVSYNLFNKYCCLLKKSIDKYFKNM